MKNKQIGIIGYGRFGRIMQQILTPEHEVFFYDVAPKLQQETTFLPLADIVKLPTIILAVPISQVESTLQQLAPHIQAKTVIDVCSVKVYPTKLMQAYLPKKTNIIATHPMFGPDSFANNQQKNMMMYAVRADDELFLQWRDYFVNKNIHISIMTPEQHDREIAFSQNLTHYIGRILGELNLHDSDISTTGYKSLLKIVQQTCHDSWELFHDMLQYNPHSKTMMVQLNIATKTIVAKLNLDNGENTHGK